MGDNKFADYQFNVTPGGRIQDLTKAMNQWTTLYAAENGSPFTHNVLMMSWLTDATMGTSSKPYPKGIPKTVATVVKTYCKTVKNHVNAVTATAGFGDAGKLRALTPQR